jgi:hypothetical protein
MTRGASKEDLFMELWEPLELNEERPCARYQSRYGSWKLPHSRSCYSASEDLHRVVARAWASEQEEV